MNFLNPAFLLLAAAAAVPLLIHIFNRRKATEVYFSSLRFIRRSERRSMRRVNLRRLLVLFLRMAAIALTAAAFARPVIRGSLAAMFPGGGPRAVCILVDRSYSMAVREGEHSLFERASARVPDIAASLGEDDEVSLILFDTGCETVFEGDRFSGETAERLMRGAGPSYRATAAGRAVDEAVEWLAARRHGVKELFIISDFQKSAQWGRSARGAVPRAVLLPVQPRPGTNVSIEKVFTPRVTLHRGETAPLRMVLRNLSAGSAARFPLRIVLDGKTVLEREIEIEERGARAVSVDLPVEKAGWLAGEVSKKEDRLAVDDRRFFCLSAKEKSRVLLVGDEGSLYLEQALSPEGAEGDIELQRKGWGEYVSADLDGADAVVLGPGAGGGARDAAVLREYARKGGKILALVMEDSGEMARQLSSSKPAIEFAGGEESFETVAVPDAAPDFLSPFEREDMERLARIPFYGAPRIRGIPDGEVLLYFRSGYPFVWREIVGEGAIMFAALDPGGRRGEIVLSPLFLPFIQQAVLAMGPVREEGEGVQVGGRIMLRGAPGSFYSVVLPDGSGISAGQAGAEGERGVRAGEEPEKDEALPAGSGLDIALPAGDSPGIIDILEDGALLMRAAVNPDCSNESDLETLSGEEAADSLGLGRRMVVPEDGDVAAGIRTAREGKDISVILIAAAVLLFLLELAIAQRREMAAETP